MEQNDKELLIELIENNTYDVIWNRLFYQKDGIWIAAPKYIRNERFKEHCEEYCNAMCIDKNTLLHIFQLVAQDAEERKSALGVYTKLDKTFIDKANREQEKKEIIIVIESRKGMLNKQHKTVLDIFGTYDNAINSATVNNWIKCDPTITQESIIQYYNNKIANMEQVEVSQ